ncbi:uncharacterized protein LOC135120489 [Zophobas morio]|uniref:uncharacterized protein LOC135120489 n=1 Tax=Zophobas morio TaxID=2755281 RepID=UPI003083387D
MSTKVCENKNVFADAKFSFITSHNKNGHNTKKVFKRDLSVFQAEKITDVSRKEDKFNESKFEKAFCRLQDLTIKATLRVKEINTLALAKFAQRNIGKKQKSVGYCYAPLKETLHLNCESLEFEVESFHLKKKNGEMSPLLSKKRAISLAFRLGDQVIEISPKELNFLPYKNLLKLKNNDSTLYIAVYDEKKTVQQKIVGSIKGVDGQASLVATLAVQLETFNEQSKESRNYCIVGAHQYNKKKFLLTMKAWKRNPKNNKLSIRKTYKNTTHQGDLFFFKESKSIWIYHHCRLKNGILSLFAENDLEEFKFLLFRFFRLFKKKKLY